MKNNYLKLCAIQEKIHNLNHARCILSWDQATLMSVYGNQARSQSIAEISSMIHELITKKSVGKLILNSQTEDLNELELANLREIKNKWLMTNELPKKLIVKNQLSQSKCEFEWRKQREKNDWKGFLKNFKSVVKNSREEAKILSNILNISPYEALIQRYDPGLKTKEIDKLFLQIKNWLPGITSQIYKKQKKTKHVSIRKSLDTKKQKNYAQKLLNCLVLILIKVDLTKAFIHFVEVLKKILELQQDSVKIVFYILYLPLFTKLVMQDMNKTYQVLFTISQ